MGDVVLLTEGDRVPADGVLISCSNLMVDESLLTGESVHVRKACGIAFETRSPGGDDLPLVGSGTLVVGGKEVARATAICRSTEMGKK